MQANRPKLKRARLFLIPSVLPIKSLCVHTHTQPYVHMCSLHAGGTIQLRTSAQGAASAIRWPSFTSLFTHSKVLRLFYCFILFFPLLHCLSAKYSFFFFQQEDSGPFFFPSKPHWKEVIILVPN